MINRCSRALALVALIGSFVAIPATSAFAQVGNARYTNRMDVPVSGVVETGGNLSGNFAISRFAIEDGRLVAIGQLTGSITDAAGIRTVVSELTWPVQSAGSGSGADDAAASCDSASSEQGVCNILNLVLGPLDLNLLGLQIDLNQVVLNITGVTGAGNLLGNLLCAITGLLDAGSLGQQVVNLLNQLIGVLAGL